MLRKEGGQAVTMTWRGVGYNRINRMRHLLVYSEAKVEEREKVEKRGGSSPPHNRKGLVVPVGCAPA